VTLTQDSNHGQSGNCPLKFLKTCFILQQQVTITLSPHRKQQLDATLRRGNNGGTRTLLETPFASYFLQKVP